MPEVCSGILNNVTTGAPMCAVIENANTRSVDYDKLQRLPRPGHADYTGAVQRTPVGRAFPAEFRRAHAGA